MKRKLLLLLIVACLLHASCMNPAFTPPAGFVKVHGERYILDFKYNSDDNFLHQNIYGAHGVDSCWLHPDAAAMLETAARSLQPKHLKLVLMDCYRPAAVQQAMWTIMPDEKYVADPGKGSNHTRCVAVYVTLATDNGTLLPMPTAFDDFTTKAGIAYVCSPEERNACNNRELLGAAMVEAGFERFPSEWWHFAPPNPERYPLIK